VSEDELMLAVNVWLLMVMISTLLERRLPVVALKMNFLNRLSGYLMV
jgi:hypothetical protein